MGTELAPNGLAQGRIGRGKDATATGLKAAENLTLWYGTRQDEPARRQAHFDTAPFERSGASPSAIREGREVSRLSPAGSSGRYGAGAMGPPPSPVATSPRKRGVTRFGRSTPAQKKRPPGKGPAALSREETHGNRHHSSNKRANRTGGTLALLGRRDNTCHHVCKGTIQCAFG
jgi:hypothetical protein